LKRLRITLQAKYIATIAFIVISTSITLSMYYYNTIRAKEVAELKAKGHTATVNLGHNSEAGVLFSDTEHLNLLASLLSEDSDVAVAEITSAKGTVLARTTSDLNLVDPSASELTEVIHEIREESGLSMTRYRVRESGVELLEFRVPITTRRIARDREEIGLMLNDDLTDGNGSEKVRIGTARTVFSSARSLRELRKIQHTIIGITAAVVLAGIMLTVPLVRITVRPIRQLAEGTRRIAAGDLSKRVVAATRDEIGELAESFNQMAVDLEKYHKELKQHSRTLEERVQRRTQEIERANAELRKAQAQLIQAGKMAAMGEFGAGVAHELNQPLAGIKGYAQLLLSMVPEDSPLRPRILQIDKQASRMKEITQTMWNLARQSKFEYRLLDIRGPVDDSLILINEQFRQHQIVIRTELEEGLPLVFGDANQLHQVFLNFLTNAKDAIDEEEGGRVKVKVAPLADRRYVQVLIMDNGKGIPEDIIDDIFNPFFTTKPPGKGTGLGLSINFSIMEQHHGFIKLYSEDRKGTIFSLIVPTEKFTKCEKHNGADRKEPVAPCWRPGPESAATSQMRRPDCKTCEIYLRFQSPPETSLEMEFRDFLAEGS